MSVDQAPPSPAPDSVPPPGPSSNAPCAEEHDGPRGLIPPSQRGRSQRLIGDIIVELGFARRETVETAVASSREQGRPTGKILIESGVIRHDQLARALAERFGVDYVDLSVFEVDKAAVNLITPDMARHYQALPVSFLSDDTVLLAMADPTNVITIDEMSMITGMTVRPAATAVEDISALIGRLSRVDETAVVEPEAPKVEIEVDLASDPVADAPIIKLVHSIISQAVERGASDIHFDPEADQMHVLFRIDGVLAPSTTIPASMAPTVISRVKIMGGNRHRRAAGAAGRPDGGDDRQPPHRRPRRDAAAGGRRGRRDEDPRQRPRRPRP
jgi:type IV pilus assembly protein PilB